MGKTMTKLSDELASALKYSDIEIPAYITQNLAKTLREYQVSALKHYLIQRKKPNTNHLMFNMATGSGKTLIMAALMIECYKQGYRNFVFFVNATSILEKTKLNFSDSKCEKYLFNDEIVINSRRVEINVVNNFSEAREDCINIIFNTIQGIYSTFTNAKENAITLDDLAEHKIVYLADEAHHLNSETKDKDKLDNAEKLEKRSWESIMSEAFSKNKANLMLEFTATIPQVLQVLDKYKDKIVFEYTLQSFYNDKFSKKIYLLKYENKALKGRFLGAILLNIFRQIVGLESGLKEFKPVILFKSETKNNSLTNEENFKEFVRNLSENEVREFYKNLDTKEAGLLALSLEFFKIYFKKDEFYGDLTRQIKGTFSEDFIINMNSKINEENRQKTINSLESKDNLIRVIFAVDRLNEGWDVLNLFDIVRCKSNDKATSKDITTKEAQLIGRGARYYPFKLNETQDKFRRKFDEDNDEQTRFLKALEALSYHALNELDFIKNLNKSLADLGLNFENDTKKVILKPQKKAKDLGVKSIKIAKNERKESLGGLFAPLEAQEKLQNFIKEHTQTLNIPLFNENFVKQGEPKFDKNTENEPENFKNQALKEILQKRVILKALNAERLNFTDLKRDFSEVKSKDEFIENYLFKARSNCHKKQNFSSKAQLEIAKFLINSLKKEIDKQRTSKIYEVLPFKVGEFSLKEREIWTNKEEQSATKYEWLVYDKFLKDSGLEEQFLNFIERIKDEISEIFEKWLVIRNEQFSELMIYDERAGDSYGKGFAPDFVFWGHKKMGDELVVQCFIEAKGEHINENKDNKWKEEFLLTLQNKIIDNAVNINGLGFFKQNNQAEFNDKFREFLKNAKVSS